MHQKWTHHPFLENGVFQIIFHIVSLPIFDSTFQKNENKNKNKNESKIVTVDNTIIILKLCIPTIPIFSPVTKSSKGDLISQF
jgi:hypothetical protein